MKNAVSIFQEVFCTQSEVYDRRHPFRLIEHVQTDTDGVRSRITSKAFATLDEAKEALRHNGY